MSSPVPQRSEPATNELLRELQLVRLESRAGFAEVRAGVADLRLDVSEARSDVSELRTDVSELRTDVSDLGTGVAGLATEVSDLRRAQLAMFDELAAFRREYNAPSHPDEGDEA